jgi:TPP-dependent pyruvate/acetoin dehydrogenase alpha subunit
LRRLEDEVAAEVAAAIAFAEASPFPVADEVLADAG